MNTVMRRIATCALLAGCVAVAVPAFADPPAHAPAHGWRKKNDPYYVGYQGRQWPSDYGVINGRCNREAVGAVVGATVGGAIGSTVGSGDGRTVAIIVGTILGAVIGAEIGEDLDKADRACIGHALELGSDGTAVRWSDASRRMEWAVTPTATLKRDGRDCRQFNLVETRDGRKRATDGMACRTGDGEWQFVK